MSDTKHLQQKVREQYKRIQELEITLQKAHNDLTLYIRLHEPDVELKTVKQNFIYQLESVKLPIERVLIQKK